MESRRGRGRRRIDSRDAPNFYLDYVNETVRIAPPRPVAPCLGVQVVLGFCRGGAATVGAFQRDVLAPALQRSVPAAACSLNDAPPVQSKGGPSIAGSSILKSNALDAFKRGTLSKDRTVYVAMGEPNTRRELALAAAEHVTLLTQAELAWGIHAEPELQNRPTSYFLLLRDPISRLLSDFVAWRDEPPTSLRARHPLAVKAKKGIRAFAEATANYHLRFLGNDTRCAPRRSACASLTSFDQSLKRANAPRSPLSSAVATQPCHLDYGAEDARVFSCALATPENILREHLAYVKRNVHSLYFAVGLHERLAESMVLWRAAARHHDAQNWPAPACVPRLAPRRRAAAAGAGRRRRHSGAQRPGSRTVRHDPRGVPDAAPLCQTARGAGRRGAPRRGAERVAAVVHARAGAERSSCNLVFSFSSSDSLAACKALASSPRASSRQCCGIRRLDASVTCAPIHFEPCNCVLARAVLCERAVVLLGHCTVQQHSSSTAG